MLSILRRRGSAADVVPPDVRREPFLDAYDECDGNRVGDATASKCAELEDVLQSSAFGRAVVLLVSFVEGGPNWPHANLPPAVLVTNGFDPLRDVGHAYARKLAAAGNDLTYIHHPDLTHGFPQFSAYSHACRTTTEDLAHYLSSHPPVAVTTSSHPANTAEPSA